MATDLRTAGEPSLTSLVTGIVNDAQELFKQQVDLLKHEVRDDFRKTREASLVLGIGGGLAVVGAIFLVSMAVYLTEYLTHLPLWACYGIWAAVTLLAGAAFLFAGKAKFASFNPLPDETAQAVKENVEWIVKKN